jgi:hypothetical protein
VLPDDLAPAIAVGGPPNSTTELDANPKGAKGSRPPPCSTLGPKHEGAP